MQAFFPIADSDSLLHDSTLSCLNSVQPLGQFSSEVLSSPDSTIILELDSIVDENNTKPLVDTDNTEPLIDIDNTESLLSHYHLPPCSNHGIPPAKYEPDPKS